MRSYLASVSAAFLLGSGLALGLVDASSARAEEPLGPASASTEPGDREAASARGSEPAPEVSASPQALLEPASTAYAELRLEDAWQAISEVIARLSGPDGASVPPATRTEAFVLAASIARARGDLAASDAALDQALALEPTLSLDPALHPPPLIEALARRRVAYEVAHPRVRSGGVDPIPPIVEPPGIDPWPIVGLGAAGLVLVGGLVVLTVVLVQPDDDFDVRGTILP